MENGIRDLNFIESLESELHEGVQLFVSFTATSSAVTGTY